MKVPSGAEVVINVAPWGDAFDLKNAVMSQIAARKIDIRSGLTFSSSVNPGELISFVAAVDSNPEVNRCLMACLQRCTYNGQKISQDTFEPEECRQDYYPIVVECLKVNLKDFFVFPASLFSGLLSKNQENAQAST